VTTAPALPVGAAGTCGDGEPEQAATKPAATTSVPIKPSRRNQAIVEALAFPRQPPAPRLDGAIRRRKRSRSILNNR
jgi:hypothetical protein